MIRVLYVSTSTTLGGAEKTLHTLATRIDPKRFEVAGIVSLKPKGPYARRLEAAGRTVVSLDGRPIPSPSSVGRLSKIIGTFHPHVVHAFMYQAIQLTRLAKRLGSGGFGLLSSPRVHYRTRSLFSLGIDRFLRSQDDLLVAESDSSRAYLRDRLGYDPRKLRTIHNGVDLAGWTASAAQRQERRLEMKISDGEILLGTTGRLDEQKGHRHLLEALSRLRVTHPARAVIVGDGPLRARLERQARELGVENAVHFTGEQPETLSWLSAMDVFVLPSLWEGFPNALLEAMGLGLPVIAANVDGVPEAVEDKTTGLLCAPGDSQALVESVHKLIADEGLRRRLGAAARASVESRFTLSRMISSYESAYQELAERAA